MHASLSVVINITASANALTDNYPVPVLAVTYNRTATASALASATPGAAAGSAAAAAPSESATTSNATAAGAGGVNGTCPSSQRFVAQSTGTCSCATGKCATTQALACLHVALDPQLVHGIKHRVVMASQ